MPDVSTRTRVRPGQPGGGRFADEPHPEHTGPGLSFDDQPAIPAELLSGSFLGIDEVPDAPGVILRDPHPYGGYDQIDRYPDGSTVFRRNGAIHRENGPALFSPLSILPGQPEAVSTRFFLNDTEIFDPSSGTGELIGLQLRTVEADGTQWWATASGHHEARVAADGSVQHFRDGDLHRDGGPAIVTTDGEEIWYRSGTRIPNGIPPEPTITVHDIDGQPHQVVTGSLYSATRTTRSLVSELEKQMQTARGNGILPIGAHAVVSYRPGGAEIGIKVTGLNRDNDYTGYLEATRIRGQLTVIAEAYQQTLRNTSTGAVTKNFDLIVDVH